MYRTYNNISQKDEDISEYKLVRKLDNRKEVSFTFPTPFVLKRGQTVKVCHAENYFGTRQKIEKNKILKKFFSDLG